MGKLIFWVLIVLCALFVMRLAAQHQKNRTKPPSKKYPPSPKASEPMVACAHCGIYLPRGEALVLHGQTWCCQAHADQHA